jgi:arylsulfatase A-like enzyme
MSTTRTVLFLFLTGLAAGWVCGMIPAIAAISAHAHLKNGMYVLAAEQMVRHLLPWMAAGGVAYALCGLSGILHRRGSSPLRIAYPVVSISLLCAALLFAGSRFSSTEILCAVCCVVLPSALLCAPRARSWVLRHQRSIPAAALACLLVALSASAWLSVHALREAHTGPSIVVIVIDCLRPDHLGCYGYGRDTSPTLDALARSGLRYDRAYVTAPWTKPSVASLFTSLMPARHGLVNPDHTASDRMLLLAEVLRNAGYRNFFINGGNVFLKKEFNLHQGFHTCDYLPQRTHSAADAARAFLDRVAGVGAAKYFAYVHFMDAHAPYTVNQHNTRYAGTIIESLAPGNPAALLSLQREPDAPCNHDPDLRQYFRDLYDGQIRFIDDAISAMLHGLARLGRLDNTVFIITADHGEEFWEHGSTEHGHTLYNELLQVPLIIAGENITAGSSVDPVQFIDLMPTVLDLAGISRTRLSLQGVSLAGGMDASLPDRALYASATLYGSETWCVIQNNLKLIYRSQQEQGKWTLKGPQAPSGYQLFDLARDPAEQNDFAGTDGIPRALENLLMDYIRMEPMEVSGKSVQVGGDDLRRQLESLGYIQ